MHLCYFDENKPSPGNRFFNIGGLLIPDHRALATEEKLSDIQQEFFGTRTLNTRTELHGKELFHGKGNAKGRAIKERVGVFNGIADFVVENDIPVRMICIDVENHHRRYHDSMPHYRLGLMLILERFCDHLDHVDDLGLAFGDYDADEVTHAVVDFSEFKSAGRTPMDPGRPLGRLLDTVYFSHSHHSRFLQVADLLVYMAGRYENQAPSSDKWHEIQVKEAWEKIKASGNVLIQRWPP